MRKFIVGRFLYWALVGFEMPMVATGIWKDDEAARFAT
jgi:hypothetical protein